MRIRPKIGLRIEGKIFWCVKLGHSDGEKEKEEGRIEVQEIQVWNFCLEYLFLYGTLVWNSCLDILVYVWVRKFSNLLLCLYVG